MTYLNERMPAEFFEIIQYIQERETFHRISLTSVARQLIVMPIYEYFIDESTLRELIRERYIQEEITTIRNSIDQLFRSITDNPSEIDLNRTRSTPEGQFRIRSATSVIKGFSLHFCSIPPFCAGAD